MADTAMERFAQWVEYENMAEVIAKHGALSDLHRGIRLALEAAKEIGVLYNHGDNPNLYRINPDALDNV